MPHGHYQSISLQQRQWYLLWYISFKWYPKCRTVTQTYSFQFVYYTFDFLNWSWIPAGSSGRRVCQCGISLISLHATVQTLTIGLHKTQDTSQPSFYLACNVLVCESSLGSLRSNQVNQVLVLLIIYLKPEVDLAICRYTPTQQKVALSVASKSHNKEWRW